MPNGGLSAEEEEELNKFFAPFAPSLVLFAERHALYLERYNHGTYSWDFRFLHPRGGIGQIVVRRHEHTQMQIHSMWWRDDYAAQTRELRDDAEPPFVPSSETVIDAAERALRRILGWDTLVEKRAGYNGWSRTPEKEFHALATAGLRLPVL